MYALVSLENMVFKDGMMGYGPMKKRSASVCVGGDGKARDL